MRRTERAMFDTMTITKVVGAFCGSLLVFLLGSWAAESVYHGGEYAETEQAYTIDTGVMDDAPAAVDGPDFETVFASADAGAGERVFSKCSACHKLNGANATGPYLDGVVGRAVDAVPDYQYSGALEQVVDVWSPEHLNGFLENPKVYAPGTKMSFNGLTKVEDRANLIAYLQTTGS
jgi:cytochrome c